MGLRSGALRIGRGMAVAAVVAGGITPTPVLTSLSSDLVDVLGGDSITITGTNLGSATACTVGGTSATITANTATTLTFTMPAKSAGSHNVQVTTAAGSSNTLSIEVWYPGTETSTTECWGGNAGYTAGEESGTFTGRKAGTLLAEATNFPDAVGGVPDFVRANSDVLKNASNLSAFIGTGDFTVAGVVELDSISSTADPTAVNPWTLEAILAENASDFAIGVSNVAGVWKMFVYVWDSAARRAVATIPSTPGTRIAFIAQKSGGRLYLSVDGGTSFIPGDLCGTSAAMTDFFVGRNDGSMHMDGRVKALVLANDDWSLPVCAKFKKWAALRAA